MTTCERAWNKLTDACAKDYTESKLLAMPFDQIRRLAPTYGITSSLDLARIEVQLKVFQRTGTPALLGGAQASPLPPPPQPMALRPRGPESIDVTPVPSRASSAVGSPARRAKTGAPRPAALNPFGGAGTGFTVPSIPLSPKLSSRIALGPKGTGFTGVANPNYIVSVRQTRSALLPSGPGEGAADHKLSQGVAIRTPYRGKGDPSFGGAVPLDGRQPPDRGLRVEANQTFTSPRAMARRVLQPRARTPGTSNPNSTGNPTEVTTPRGKSHHYQGGGARGYHVGASDPNETRREAARPPPSSGPSPPSRRFAPMASQHSGHSSFVGGGCTLLGR